MVQVKTNERKKPWDPKPEDQKVDGKNYRDGKDQLIRDALRFFELFPDIKTNNVKCNFSVAFPLASKSDEKEVLTQEDFEEDHQDTLLAKLGISYLGEDDVHPQPEMEETYVRLVARYLGQHSQIPSKKASEALVKGLETLNMAVQSADSVFGSVATDTMEMEEEENCENSSNAKKAISSDRLMQKIRRAKEDAKYRKVFEKQNGKIPFAELKINKQTKLLFHSKHKTHPLYGNAVTDAVLQALDENSSHQGPAKLIERLTQQKFVLHTEHAEEEDHTKVVNEHCNSCGQCKEVKAIRDLLPDSSDGLLQIPEELVQRVIAFGDLKHQGSTKCLKRLKSWCTFLQDFDKMVNNPQQYSISFAQIPSFPDSCTLFQVSEMRQSQCSSHPRFGAKGSDQQETPS